MEPGLLRSLASLGDMARLRLLRLVEQEELSVGELAKVLQLPQSTISRHLKLLHESGEFLRESVVIGKSFRQNVRDTRLFPAQDLIDHLIHEPLPLIVREIILVGDDNISPSHQAGDHPQVDLIPSAED